MATTMLGRYRVGVNGVGIEGVFPTTSYGRTIALFDGLSGLAWVSLAESCCGLKWRRIGVV